MKKVLITGITGFAGSHLAELLTSKEEQQIHGTYVSDTRLGNIASFKDKLTLHRVNLNDADETLDLIEKVAPDIVYHLAASTHVGESFKKPIAVITNNISSQVNLLEAVIQHKIPVEKIIVVSSAHVYGYVSPEDLPLREESPFKPDNPYSVSKIAQDYLGYSYYLSHKLPIVRIRPGNHTGPRHSSELATSRFAKYIVEIEKGKKEPVITVGNMTTKRDYTDVRDVVRGYILAVEHCQNGEVYNIGSGVAHKMHDILAMLLHMSNVKIKVESDRALFRPSDIPELRIDATKFRQATGWKPEIPIEKTLQDTLNYWRTVLS